MKVKKDKANQKKYSLKKQESHSFREHKKYAWLVSLITLLIYITFVSFVLYFAFESYFQNERVPIVEAFVILCAIVFVVFWYHSIFSLVLLVLKFLFRNRLYKFYDNIINNYHITKNHKVAILYVTMNDFIPESLQYSLRQRRTDGKYKAFIDVFVLDDSNKPEYIKQIDEFKNQFKGRGKRKIQIIRRNGVGPKNKAGNINFFFKKYLKKYDYFVIQDADTYLPYTYVMNSLKYFTYYKDIGILQAANNAIVNSKTNFQKYMTPSVTKNPLYWGLDGILLDKYGATQCTGHACMISRKCYESVGGMYRDCISEDWSLSIDARNQGFHTAYAPNILCCEEIPPNYTAFKKRQMRWTRSAFQFCCQYHFRILFGKFTLAEKYFLINYTSNCWTTSFISFILNILSFIILFFIPSGTSFSLLPGIFFYMIIGLFIVGLLLVIGNAIITKTSIREALLFSLASTLTTTSMLPSLFFKVVMVLFGGKNRFNRSIKHNTKMTFGAIWKTNWEDFISWIGLFSLAITSCSYSGLWWWLLNPLLFISFLSFLWIIPISYSSNHDAPKDFNPVTWDYVDAKPLKKIERPIILKPNNEAKSGDLKGKFIKTQPINTVEPLSGDKQEQNK